MSKSITKITINGDDSTDSTEQNERNATVLYQSEFFIQ